MAKSTAVLEAEDAAAAASVKRKARIEAIEAYSGLVIGKGAGLTGLIAGGIELLNPNFLPLDSKQGLYALGAGLALVAGNKAIAVLNNFFGSFK